jgi:hypothetical protein
MQQGREGGREGGREEGREGGSFVLAGARDLEAMRDGSVLPALKLKSFAK